MTKVLLTVKTYPTVSEKYGELVCSAGMLEDGSWVRIYPVPLRQMPNYKNARKYCWFELDIVRNGSDFRPETYRPRNQDTFNLEPLRYISTGKDRKWRERKDVILKQSHYTNMAKLISDAKDRQKLTSLAVFKPNKVIKVHATRAMIKGYSPRKTERLKQASLFEGSNDFKNVPPLPWNFRYEFADDEGVTSKLSIIDWEIGALYWGELKRFDGNEQDAVNSVINKYQNQLVSGRDTYFFLGTRKNDQLRTPNPFGIIGVFYPPVDNQLSLFS